MTKKTTTTAKDVATDIPVVKATVEAAKKAEAKVEKAANTAKKEVKTEKTADAKAAKTTTAKKEEKTDVKKATAKKAVEKTEEKATAKKAVEKTEEKTTAKKTAAKKDTKPAAKKTTAKKEATKAENNIFVQFSGLEFDTAKIEADVKADYMAKNNKKTMKSVSIYIKPEDMKAYYVIDGIIGDVAL